MDLEHVQKNLPLVTSFASANFDALTLKWTSSNPDVVATDGKITRACQIRVVRDGIVVAEDKIDSLRRFKDDVKEVAQGYECGIGLEKFGDIKEGDVLEAFIIEEYRD